MKKLLIALLIVAVLIGGVFAYAAVNANALIESYKPKLEEIASGAIGSKVTLGTLSVSIFPRPYLIINELRVVSDEEASEPFSLENLTLKIKLLPLLTKKLVITRLGIRNPNVTFILDEDGIYIAGLPRTDAGEESTEQDTSVSEDTADTEIPIDVDLKSFAIENASILLKDTIADLEYTISDLNVYASLSLSEGRVTMTTLNGDGIALDDIEFSFNGSDVTYILDTGAIGISKLEARSMGSTFALSGTLDANDPQKSVTLSSDGIALADLGPLYNVFAPGLTEMNIQGALSPSIKLALAPEGAYTATGSVGLAGLGASVDPFHITAIDGTVKIDANQDIQRVHAEKVSGKFNGAPMEMDMELSIDGAEIAREQLHVTIFSGTVDLNSVVLLAEEIPTFTLELNAANVQIGEALKALLPDVEMELTGTAAASANLEGVLDEELLISSTTGKAKLELHDGILQGINLGSEILGAVKNLQFITGNLLGSVPGAMARFIRDDHTMLKTVRASFDVADETLTTNDLFIDSTYFSLDAKGTIDFDTTMNLESTIYFSPEFSAGLVQTTKELELLLDKDGRLVFPVKIKGKPPGLIVVPDVSKLLTSTVKKTIRDEGRKLIRDLLNRND